MITVPLTREGEADVSRYRGKHRAPNMVDTVVDNSSRITAAVVTTGVFAAVPVLTASPALAAAPREVRDAIISCESGGNPRAQNGTSTASGLYQFINSTWKAYGGSTPRARDASVAEQHRVFERAFADAGTKPWEADPRSENCWRPKIGKVDLDIKDDAPTTGKRASGETKEPKAEGKRRAGTEIPDGYVVKSGDTLNKLTKRFGVDGGASAIASANGIDNPNLIFVGQVLN